ncbi:MAG: hypothetical protein KC646_17355 [Candidatus Cloacimonetes bacterium]|nr:hypothetical protein [Candidatus Cloacimonadota bacterium]
MKYFNVIICVYLGLAQSFAQETCSTLDFKNRVYLQETAVSAITPFVYNLKLLDYSKNKIGIIKNKMFKLKSVMELRDNDKNLIATAKARYVSWGTHISFYDCNNKLVGKIIEDSVLRRAASLGSSQKYTFFDQNKQKLGDISKADMRAGTKLFPVVGNLFYYVGLFRSANFQATTPNTEGVDIQDAKATRSFVQGLGDEWTLTFTDDFSKLKKLMFLFLPAYRTRVDSVLKPESSQKLSKKKALYESLYKD